MPTNTYIGSYIIKLKINMDWNERSENTTKHNVIFVHFLHIHLYLALNIFVGILSEMEPNMGVLFFFYSS